MKKTWDVKDVEIVPMILPVEEYNQRLEEAAELVYRYFCQLQENQALVPETETANHICEKRTGTNG